MHPRQASILAELRSVMSRLAASPEEDTSEADSDSETSRSASCDDVVSYVDRVLNKTKGR